MSSIPDNLGPTKRSTTSTSTSTSPNSTENELSTLHSNHLNDAGNKSNDHYKSKLSPLRYKLRALCLPIIRKETEILANMQKKVRHPILDFYFAWTANLASHTFYVLMLPLPIWFGASTLSRDLLAVLGLGIFITGNLKDFYVCLDRGPHHFIELPCHHIRPRNTGFHRVIVPMQQQLHWCYLQSFLSFKTHSNP